ncbi:MAG: DUF4112 domain-containing protein [Niabella sp.]
MGSNHKKTLQPVTEPLPDPRLKMVQRVSKLMDEQFSIGGFKFGLDPLLNLIPFAGDITTYIISVVLVLTMVQHGASGKVAMKMLGNVALDALVGAIPFLGWIFDFAYKANMRNVKLLHDHYTYGKHKGSAGPIIVWVLIIAFLLFMLVAYLAFKLLQWLFAMWDTTW